MARRMSGSIGSIMGRKSVDVVVNGVKRVGKECFGHIIRGRSSEHLVVVLVSITALDLAERS